jgi:hypothetical protein
VNNIAYRGTLIAEVRGIIVICKRRGRLLSKQEKMSELVIWLYKLFRRNYNRFLFAVVK